MSLEIEKLGVHVSDNALKRLLKMINLFLKIINFQELSMKNF